MKYIKIVSLLFVVLVLGSCTTFQKSATTVDIDAYVVQYPTVADLEISPKKVSKSTSWVSLFSTTNKETRKENLTAELLSESDADVLVEPHYIHKKNVFDNTLTVSGFPAKFKNFRKATDKDLEALKCGNPNICEVSDRVPAKKYKKKDKKHRKFLFF